MAKKQSIEKNSPPIPTEVRIIIEGYINSVEHLPKL